MEIKYIVDDRTLYLYFIGELDEHSAKLCRDKLDALIDSLDIDCVILDLKDLLFSDSTGIGLLIGRYKKLQLRCVPVFIKNPKPQIEKVFSMTGLFQIMPKIS